MAPSSECPEEGCVICEVLSKIKLQVAISFSAAFYRSAVRWRGGSIRWSNNVIRSSVSSVIVYYKIHRSAVRWTGKEVALERILVSCWSEVKNTDWFYDPNLSQLHCYLGNKCPKSKVNLRCNSRKHSECPLSKTISEALKIGHPDSRFLPHDDGHLMTTTLKQNTLAKSLANCWNKICLVFSSI